jgi:hypothetical protein
MSSLYTFATQTAPIPLSELDSNFSTPITLGSTNVLLGGTYTTLTGLTLSSPALTSPVLGTPVSGNFSSGSFTWPTFNQNTTGTASNITGTYIGTISSSQITTGLGFTPYNATNPSNYTSNTLSAGTGISVSASTGASTISLSNTAVTSGSYTNANITVNAQGQITLASNGSAGGVTSVTGTSPISSSGGSTPAISISQATTSTNGYLSSTDWNTFNNKGTVTSVTGTAPVVSSGGATPAISMAAATTSVNGYLTSSDWNTFNGKQSYVPYVDVRNYGYSTSASGATNATAINNAIAALPSTGGSVYFPQGLANISSTITVNYPTGSPAPNYALTFIGAGSDVTVLQFNGCDGFIINAQGANQYIHFMDMAITTNAANTYTGVAVNNTPTLTVSYSGQSDFTRVSLRGSTPYTYNWGCGINVIGMGNINFDGVNIYGNAAGTAGIGISVAGNVSSGFPYGIVYNIDKCGLYNLGIGINYGTYVQGVTVSQTNIVNGTTGIYLASGSVGATQMSCTLCNFDTQANQIFLNADCATVNITGNSFYVKSGAYGLYAAAGNGYTIVGNSFYGSPVGTGTAVYVAGTSTGVVTGNAFEYVNTGVNLTGSSTGWNVQANIYPSTTTQVANIGSNSVGVATK